MLFTNVKFFLSESLPIDTRNELANELEENGGKQAESLDSCTHVITNSSAFEGYREVGANVKVVTTSWVEKSVALGKPQNPDGFSADPGMIFSGVVACAADLLPVDLEVLSAGLAALGGQWRSQYTKDATHMFTLRSDSDIYRNAMEFQKHSGVKIVTPHWFDDSVKLGIHNLDTTPYEWPNPQILQRNEKKKQDTTKKAKSLDPEKEALLKIAAWSEDSDIPVTPARDTFGKRRVLLSASLELGDRRVSVETGIKRAGGKVVKLKSPEEEEDKVNECDVFITKFRSGATYFKAVKSGKTVGTLQWLFHVQATGVLSRPLDQLLHYPYPNKPIENFTNHEITITNYTGEARDYLKKLIAAMGAQFTPTMSPRNTVLIAADTDNGAKTERAHAWSIPIVNHLWLEDCFVQWRNLTVGTNKYISHPPGLDFYTCIGQRGVSRALEDLEEIVKAEIEEQEAAAELLGDGHGTIPPGTENSAKDAREVANYIEPDAMEWDDGLNLGVGMDVDDAPITPRRSPKKTPTRPSSVKKASSSMRRRKEEDEEEDELVIESRATPRTRTSTRVIEDSLSIRKKRSQKKADDDVDMDDVEEEKENQNGRLRNAKTPIKPKSKKVAGFVSEDDSDDIAPVPRPKKSPHEKDVQDLFNDDLSELTISPTKSHANHSKAGPSRHPASPTKSTVNVVLTTYKPGTSSTSRGVVKTESIHVAAREEGSRRRTKSDAPPSSPPSSAINAPRTKRSAATKASQVLHDTIMPDVLSYQQQVKNSKTKGGRKSLGAFASADTEDRSASPARRVSTMHLNDEGESEVEPPPTSAKKGKGKTHEESTHRKGKKIKDETEDDDGSGPSRPMKRKAGSKQAKDEEEEEDMETEPESSTRKKRKTEPGEEIRIATTQVILSQDVQKALTKLGAKMEVAKPWICTHLVVKSLVRTEKFLCAVAVGAHIVSEKWALDCASAKMILPEEKYPLRDPEGEAKYEMNLKRSLERARKGKQEGNKLLERHVFYITRHLSTDVKLLKNVISASGGQLITSQTPTPRVIESNPELRHVISCPEDANIWRPISQKGFKIYSPEVILTGVLRQEIDWENEKWMVEGSF